MADDEYVYNALKYGASGYLLKGVTMEELVNAVCTLNSGGVMIYADIVGKVISLFSKMAKADFSIGIDENLTSELSKTEWKVI